MGAGTEGIEGGGGEGRRGEKQVFGGILISQSRKLDSGRNCICWREQLD